MNKRIIDLHPATPGWMVQSDFDGTISVLDVTDSLLQRFGQTAHFLLLILDPLRLLLKMRLQYRLIVRNAGRRCA